MNERVNLQPFKIFDQQSAINNMSKFAQAIESRFDIVLSAFTKSPQGTLHSCMMSKY